MVGSHWDIPETSLMSRFMITQFIPRLTTMPRTSWNLVYLISHAPSGMWSLTEWPTGCERWLIFLHPPSCLGTRPRGELMKGHSWSTSTIRWSARSLRSFLSIISVSTSADNRFFEKISASVGPS